MAVVPNAPVRISAFTWVPPFARGLVRDLRVRWALDEAGVDYAVRPLDPRVERPADYLLEQPFGQVPSYIDPNVRLFESGAIVLHVANRCEALLPAEAGPRARHTAWVFAALNTIEVWLQQLVSLELFHAGESWVDARRPQLADMVARRLRQLEAHLGGRPWLEERFGAGDLMMTTVLRSLRAIDRLDAHPRLAAYVARAEERPAFQRALAAQLAGFTSET